jgi:hypothetical protein
MRIHFGSLYSSWLSRISLLGAGTSASLGMACPQGLVVMGERKFFSVPLRNLILQAIVPFFSSRWTRTLWPSGAKSAYPRISIAFCGQAFTQE